MATGPRAGGGHDVSRPSAFDIVIPLADDAAATADVHLRAMERDVLTNAQFPNPQAWEYFRGWLAENTREHIQHPSKGVLIARDPTTGDIASLIKWLEYGQAGEVSVAPPAAAVEEQEWPECCGRSILNEYASIAGDIRRRVLGQRPYFQTLETPTTDVTFLCTDPKWGGRGAASALLRELEAMAEDAGKAIVLEGVISAVPLYKRLGFETRQQLQMMLPPRGSTERTERYLEHTMVWTPPSLEP
ncbi:GNAT family acetyltransferase [Metarhizium album ARSEF 1941]|uniref:GNAT family acetyltransferase n=1 Tax=Metarhizium album (strain ARSEF 1941) TaxID=1081103 RepID=A0A0B2WZU8_METAS|nr:GNAT family acetyltransferase [Metarhizium album ARSEF 1941]KHN99114.1 GNAT family acetyltransferase [Metarhizium album ARSEF 1941]